MKKNLNNSKLIAYTAAAGAALAIAPNAFGTIIHQTVNINFGNGPSGTKDLTMQGSNPEVSFRGSLWGGMSTRLYCLRLNDNFSECGNPPNIIKALSAGDYVGPATNKPNYANGNFFSASMMTSRGEWTHNNQTNYFGVSFEKESGGKVYGWIQLERLTPSSGKVIAYAYEDDGTRIPAGAIPEPTSALALLALGAAGIAAYRRKRF